MNETVTKPKLRRPQNETFESLANHLLSEYREKLNDLCGKIRNLRREISEKKGNSGELNQEINDQVQLLNRLKPPARALAQHISQKIEHGKLDELTKLELRLRLAEFEHAILAADRTH